MSHADLPQIKPRELIRALEKMGFQLLRKILRDIEVDAEELRRWL